jgi:hypothetical protein
MGKLITFVLAIAVISGAVWYALNHMSMQSSGGTSAPKRQLDNVRQAATRMENDADQRAKELEAKMQ